MSKSNVSAFTEDERKARRKECARRSNAKRWQDPEYRAMRLAKAAAWRKANPELVKLKEKARDMVKQRDTFMKRAYGITSEDYDRLLVSQNGVCAICRKPARKRLAVDHCHTTGRVRGLLCFKCNSAIGSFNDDPLRVAAACAYLEKK